MRSLLLLILAGLVLSGCATTQPEPIIKYKTIVIAPEDALLVDCEVSAPPVIKDYLALPNWTLKEGVLVDLNQKQMTDAITCNVRMEKLRAWKAEQLKLYEDKKT